jgi:hypothetical protein
MDVILKLKKKNFLYNLAPLPSFVQFFSLTDNHKYIEIKKKKKRAY